MFRDRSLHGIRIAVLDVSFAHSQTWPPTENLIAVAQRNARDEAKEAGMGLKLLPRRCEM